MKSLTKVLPIAAFAVIAILSVGAQTADEIVVKSMSPEGVLTLQAHVDMTISRVNGTVLHRSARQYWARDGETIKRLVAFEGPSGIKNTRFLAVADAAGANERLIFSPRTGKVSEVESAEAARWFMGSDFTLEDISPHNDSLNDNVLIRKDKFGDTLCYVVESRPKTEGQYVRVVRWISTENFVLLKADLYDRGGLAKRLVASRIETIGGIPTACSLEMKDLRHWSSTVLDFSDIHYNQETPAALFTTAYLAKGAL